MASVVDKVAEQTEKLGLTSESKPEGKLDHTTAG